MAQISTNWEKGSLSDDKKKKVEQLGRQGNRTKFLIGGIIILAAVAYLIVSSTLTGARYFITVEEIINEPTYIGETVRISGAVIGESIEYDEENLIINLTISHIPTEFDDLATALHESVYNEDAARLPVHVENQVKPDLLQNEAQAILTGYIDENGVFQANELLLKCPSRFEDGGPDQSIANDA